MHKLAIVAAPLAALLSLAACNNEPEVINNYDPQAEALAKAPPVELPPSIRASHTYRCQDNSLLYANFYTDDTARIADTAQGAAAGLQLTAGEGGNPPYTAEGYSLSGSGDQVSYTAPGKGTQTCKA